MSPADARAAEFFRNAQVHLRAAKKSLSVGRGFLPACPRDVKALKLAAVLLGVERELEALSQPTPVQQFPGGRMTAPVKSWTTVGKREGGR